MQITTYKKAREFLEELITLNIYDVMKRNAALSDPLERMWVLLDLLGNPQKKFQSVLVGGTSGKGSTAYLIAHALTTAGYKTGLSVKPHLQKINERMQINEIAVLDQEFLSLLNKVVPVVEQMKKMRVGKPSYLETLVALAFLCFAKEKVDIAVVEVAMGGEFDATNTLEPLVAVITNVSLDHTEYLGKTVTKIAKTKAGIIKKYEARSKDQEKKITKPVVVTGVKQSSVRQIVENRCKEVGSPLYRLRKDFMFTIKKEGITGSVFDFSSKSSRLRDLQLSLIGRYQVDNASLAIETILQLRKFGFAVSEKNIRKALQTAFFPGRFEIIKVARGPATTFLPANARSSDRSINDLRVVGSPPTYVTPRNYFLDANSYTLILDGAHNPEKMKAFTKALETIFPKRKKVFIFSCKKTKDITSMLSEILRVADTIIVTEFHATTDMAKNAAMDAESIKDQVVRRKGKKDVRVIAKSNAKEALQKSLKITKSEKNSLIVVTGSIYLVGEVRSLFCM